ncbi:hypothetical protein Acr_18g0006470 [Actinidia rufa]|uniref:CCHC-type domain-containing protein n=1 Tax=Actinidia rufa TaxID=165716 RepID=A0A7J0G6S6_9ERIC|nr:hypothetical protein Acr_18g0006470 [Actinidia rufa]
MESQDWVLNSGTAYHFCRDRKVFYTYAPCKGRVWMANNTTSSVVGKGGELLSNMGPVVLARRIDKGSNHCIEVHKAIVGVLGGSVMVPRGSGAVQERREMLWDMYRSLVRHEWCNQCRMSIEKLRGRRSMEVISPVVPQERRDGATTTHKVTYFAAHPVGGCFALRNKVPAPNRVENGVRTRLHAPPENLRVKSISTTCTGEYLRAHTCRRGACMRYHAPGKAPTRPHVSSGQSTCLHAPEVEVTCVHAPARLGRGVHAPARCFYCDQKEHIKRDCPKYKAHDQSSDAAATVVMVVDKDEIDILLVASEDGKSDWVLDSASRVVGKWSVRFRMVDGRPMTLTEVRHVPNLRKKLISIGGTLRVSKENKEMLWKKKTRGLYTDWRGVSKQGELLSDMGPIVLVRRMDKGSNHCTEVRKAIAGVLGGSVMVLGGSGADVHREAQRKETKSILRSCTTKGSKMPKRVSFALDLISGGDLCSCAHKGGEMEPRQLVKFYGGAGSKTVRKDNLKTSDYPPVGWRERLLSPAHLDESKSSIQAQAPLEFI